MSRTLIVTGGRDYADRAFVFETLDRLHAESPIDLVVHGACGWSKGQPELHLVSLLRGADRWAHEWALARGVDVEPRPADWRFEGRAAGPKRNARMLFAHPDAAVAVFPGGKGTEDCARRAFDAGHFIIDLTRAP